MHARTHARNTHMHANTHMHTHTQAHAHTTCTHIHTCTCTHMHTHAHTHTCKHTWHWSWRWFCTETGLCKSKSDLQLSNWNTILYCWKWAYLLPLWNWKLVERWWHLLPSVWYLLESKKGSCAEEIQVKLKLFLTSDTVLYVLTCTGGYVNVFLYTIIMRKLTPNIIKNKNKIPLPSPIFQMEVDDKQVI